MDGISLQYPIGKYQPVGYSEQQKKIWLNDIRYLPELLEHAINGLDAFQFETPYREGGWQVRQVVHHLADSHMNAFIRCRLALTEKQPIVKPYDEKAWAELPDVFAVPVNMSVTLLHALHARWYTMMSNIEGEQWERTIYHPVYGNIQTLWFMLGSYAWHGKHHVAHITSLRERMNW